MQGDDLPPDGEAVHPDHRSAQELLAERERHVEALERSAQRRLVANHEPLVRKRADTAGRSGDRGLQDEWKPELLDQPGHVVGALELEARRHRDAEPDCRGEVRALVEHVLDRGCGGCCELHARRRQGVAKPDRRMQGAVVRRDRKACPRLLGEIEHCGDEGLGGEEWIGRHDVRLHGTGSGKEPARADAGDGKRDAVCREGARSGERRSALGCEQEHLCRLEAGSPHGHIFVAVRVGATRRSSAHGHADVD